MVDKDWIRLEAIVEGNVQGVGFRYFVLETAQALGLTGWVRNRWDETVEVVAEGPQQAIDNLSTALHRGPRVALVSTVREDRSPAQGEFSGFIIRHTE